MAVKRSSLRGRVVQAVKFPQGADAQKLQVATVVPALVTGEYRNIRAKYLFECLFREVGCDLLL
jgi:hypothetical protein